MKGGEVKGGRRCKSAARHRSTVEQSNSETRDTAKKGDKEGQNCVCVCDRVSNVCVCASHCANMCIRAY